MAHELDVNRVLVICPTSLKHQWEREIARFVECSVSVIAGLRARRAEQFAVASFFKTMNYDTVHSDLDLIEAWSTDLVMLDEAQRIKNWNTRAARSVKKIRSAYAIVSPARRLKTASKNWFPLSNSSTRIDSGRRFAFCMSIKCSTRLSGWWAISILTALEKRLRRYSFGGRKRKC